MKKNFNLTNGKIIFDENGITIVDDAKKQSLLRIFSSSLWSIYGIISILRFMKTGDQFLLWTGLLIGISHLMLLLITLLFRTSKREIKKADIKSVELKQRFGNHFLDIKLAGNKVRRMNGIETVDNEFKHFIKVNFQNS